MKKIWLFLPVVLLLLNACKDKKKVSLKDNEEVTVSEFIEAFPALKLPVQVADTTLGKKLTDSALIGYKIFTRFIPDSILTKDFGTVRPKLYSIGRVKEKEKETYLFVKAVAGSKRAGYLLCFDDKDKFLQALPLVRTGYESWTSAYGVLDKKFQITVYHEKRQGSQFNFKRNVYIYNSSANEFTLIVTEPNEEIIQNVINPIDTLPAKSKFAGDYIKNKQNFISIRDGHTQNHILFFVHFEKNNGECKGELKGTARFVNNTTAVYQESGNPCELQLVFGKTAVTMKEAGGCGSFRDIKCFFEGSFPKKRSPKTEDNKKKK